MIRVLIVDNQKNIREDLKTFLEQESNLQVIGTAEDNYAALERVIELNPDLVLIDLVMSGMDGISTAQIIHQNYPQIKLIAWSNFESQELVNNFLRVGGKGYLLKDTPREELVTAISLVNRGYIQVSPSLTAKTPKNISQVVEFLPVTATNKREKIISHHHNWVQRLQKTFNFASEKVNTEFSAIASTSAPVISQSYPLQKSDRFSPITNVPIEANELLPPVSNWTILGGLVTVSAIALATIMTMFTQYKVVVKGDATVRPVGELKLVQAATNGTIIDIAAKLNQSVKQGDLIATVDSSQLHSQINQLQTNIQQAKLQLTQVAAQVNAIESRIQAEIEKNKQNLASATVEYRRSLREYQDKQITTVAEVEEAEAALKLAQDELTRYQQLVNNGVISQLQLTEKQAAYHTAQARLKRVKTSLNPSYADVELAQENIAQQQAIEKATLANLKQEKASLIQQKTTIDQLLSRDRASLQQLEQNLKQTQITATADGIIAKLNLRNPGQTVTVAEEIAQIVPSNSAMEIKAKISPQDISKVQLKQPVDLRVSACPYPDFGTLKGVVSYISPDTLSSRKTNNSSLSHTSEQNFYEVTIIPDNLVLAQGNQQCFLQLGMEGRADIITNQETVWQFLFRKFRLNTNL